jgi:segregation and condensation protein B
MNGTEIPLDILRLTEAFVFASLEPVTPNALRPLLPEHLDAFDVLLALKRHCADRGVVLVEAGDGWTFRTAPDLSVNLRTALSEPRRLPRVAMEILVIIALHQPITRPEIEHIRGVSLSQLSMDVLMEAGLIKPWGRKEAPGRPTLWVTTELFLAQFGLKSLHELPGAQLLAPGPLPRDSEPEAHNPADDGDAGVLQTNNQHGPPE